MNLKALTDDELHASTIKTADRQREVTLELLNHLNEVERRHLFSKFNCSSLHGYCVQELKMTSGTACHHMDAARLLRQVPVIEEKILSGAIAMTTLANAESFFKREARSGNKFDAESKERVLEKLENASTKEAERILISHSAQPEIHFREKVTVKTETMVEMKIHLDNETLEMLERLKEIWSHAMPHASFADLIKRAAKEAIERHDRVAKSEKKHRAAKKATPENDILLKSEMTSQISTPSAPTDETDAKLEEVSTTADKTPSPGSKADIKRAIWKRDQCQCTFKDPRTGERCRSKYFIEEDHIHPKAMGGEYSLVNIRLRCRAHNQRHAINCYGLEKMSVYMN